jgi:hypothetical protein
MAKILQFRRYNTAALANTVGANGELIIDSSNGTISVHNGTTSGGKRLATETYVVNTANQLITAAVPTRLGQLTNDFGYITSSASITGGSATAIRLFTPRYINGVAFDGTANITISSANTVEALAQSAFTQANTASNTASSAQANTIILQGVNTTQNTRITALESGLTRTTINANTASLASNATGNVTITGYKSYLLYKIQTSAAAWVRIYTDTASRAADASRNELTDPNPGSGVISEAITTSAETILISPGVIGFSNESTPSANIELAVTNKSNGTTSITVTLTVLRLEA